jgi:hypothetical protein
VPMVIQEIVVVVNVADALLLPWWLLLLQLDLGNLMLIDLRNRRRPLSCGYARCAGGSDILVPITWIETCLVRGGLCRRIAVVLKFVLKKMTQKTRLACATCSTF